MRRFGTSDDVEIAYRDEGRGVPIVLVHGWMMSGRVWDRQVEAFRHQARVIVPDLRGCGESGSKPRTYRVPRYADDLRELLDHLDVRRAVVVGWSMGGGILMEYLARAGIDRVAGVCLVDFPPRLEEEPAVADKVCHQLSTRKDEFARSFLRRMFLEPLSPEAEAGLLDVTRRCAAETACEMYRAMRHDADRHRSGAYPLPALLCFPEKGWFFGAVEKWRSWFRDVEAPPFPKSKHCPFLEEPDSFNAALRGLVERATQSR